MDVEKWFSEMGWKENPFTLKISPEIFVGYAKQREAALRQIKEGHKITLITGPTGSGKTSMLKWLESTQEVKTLYLTKPPKRPEEFVDIFLEFFPQGFLEKLFGRKPTLFSLPDYINRKCGRRFLFLLDEAHETNRDVLEWLRVLTDQINGVSLFLAGLPKLEVKIKNELESLDQRITARISLDSLSEEETVELVRKRIESVGGKGTEPFTRSALSVVYRKTNGFPREVIKLCNKLVNDAIEKGKTIIDAEDAEHFREFSRKAEEPVVSAEPQPRASVEELPKKQRKILEILSREDWLTPGEIAEKLGGEYKTREHAVRSVNNILKRLLTEGYVAREPRGKAYVYTLTPKVRAYFVEA